MLILTRRTGETILIGHEISVTVLAIHGNEARIGISAPKDIAVHREEVAERIARQAVAAQPRCAYCGTPRPAGSDCINDLCLTHGDPK